MKLKKGVGGECRKDNEKEKKKNQSITREATNQPWCGISQGQAERGSRDVVDEKIPEPAKRSVASPTTNIIRH